MHRGVFGSQSCLAPQEAQAVARHNHLAQLAMTECQRMTQEQCTWDIGRIRYEPRHIRYSNSWEHPIHQVLARTSLKPIKSKTVRMDFHGSSDEAFLASLEEAFSTASSWLKCEVASRS